MEREILFQAKRKDNDEWVSGDLRQWSETSMGICDRDLKRTFPVRPETVRQFTGFTGFRKAKLFEHDVVTAKFKGNGARFNFKIIFRDGCFLFDNGCAAVRFDEIRSVRKIGNIHDNPELMRR